MIIDVHQHFAPKELFERYGALNKPTWRYQDPTLEFTFYHKLYEWMSNSGTWMRLGLISLCSAWLSGV